jgi:recombination endonuclease VII
MTEEKRQRRAAAQRRYYAELKKDPVRVARTAKWRESYLKHWYALPETKEYARGKYLKWKYGLTLAAFDSLLAGQGGKCAICRTGLPPKSHWHVDHSHKNGHVRGILCSFCNRGLGCFRDDPESLARAAQYLLMEGD